LVSPVAVTDVAGGLPVTWIGVSSVVPSFPEVAGITVYDVIGLPPSSGADHDTVAVVFPAVAVTLVGAAGCVRLAGVTEFDAADGGPVPTELVADTVNVYATPGVRLLTLALDTGGALLTVTGVWAVDPTYGVMV